MTRKAPRECSNTANHTPHPVGYLAHGEWAERMMRTHEQVRCAVCGLWEIWVPKVADNASPGLPPAIPSPKAPDNTTARHDADTSTAGPHPQPRGEV